METVKIEKFKCDILSNFPTMCHSVKMLAVLSDIKIPLTFLNESNLSQALSKHFWQDDDKVYTNRTSSPIFYQYAR